MYHWDFGEEMVGEESWEFYWCDSIVYRHFVPLSRSFRTDFLPPQLIRSSMGFLAHGADLEKP